MSRNMMSDLAGTVDAALESSSFSGVVSIRHGASILYERAAGYADRSNKIPNTLETRFGIASGTKFLTALAIGKLIEAGRISFSTRLVECVAVGFPRYSSEITIRHLLTHTSGIPDYFDEEKVTDFENFRVAIPWSEMRGPRDYLRVFPDEEMKFAPGERFSYSNSGYILLGVVIEELTGMRYQDFVEQELFRAIGMDRSGFFALNRLPEKTAIGYVEEADGWRTNVFNLPVVGASDGGAFSTAKDIASLWRVFWRGEILSKELTDLYSKPSVLAGPNEKRTHYGHGLWIREKDDHSRDIYFSGCDAGVSFRSIVNREKGLQVTILSNTTHGAWPVLKVIEACMGG